MHEELKFCPFCGGKVNLRAGIVMKLYTVYCRTCGASVGEGDGRYKTIEEAVAAWNRRVKESEKCQKKK